MRAVFICFVVSLMGGQAWSKSITEDQNYSYEVMFTNPECAQYDYPVDVFANNGQLLKSKPKNAFCTAKDRLNSGGRENSPQQRLVDWIADSKVSSISLAFFSFSDSRVLGELCSAVARGVRVRLVIDQENQNEKAPQELKKCGGELIPRGNVSGIKLAHIKLVIFENNEDEILRVVFGSGNLSSGTVLHHENWNFVQTSKSSYFAQDHLCAYQALESSESGAEFRSSLKQCRLQIRAQKESDIQSFFIPADNKPAIDTFLGAFEGAQEVSFAAHRFSNKKIFDAIEKALSLNRAVNLVVDDDVYWAQKGLTVGANTRAESNSILALEQLGMNIQFVETNHFEMLLHHNKFVLFDESSVWTGAGNLTDSGFSDNYENFYFIRIPEVVEHFNEQYRHLWSSLSTPRDLMPRANVKPVKRE